MGKWMRALGLESSPELLSEEPLGDYSSDVTPPARSSASVVVTEDRALALPALFRGVQLIAAMGAQLTLEAWRGGQKIESSLVAQPDPWRPLSSFLERILVCLILDGNAFLRKHRGPLGDVVALEVLNPRHVYIRRSKGGVKLFDIWSTDRGQERGLTDRDIEHVWGLEVFGHDRGLGPITACRVAVAGIINVREYADQWFDNPDVPSGILTTDQKLDPGAGKAYKRHWYGLDLDEDDPDAGRVGPRLRILGQGLSYEAGILKPADAQWLESQAFGVLDIARMLGLPGDYLMAAVEGSSLTYSNLTMIKTQFLETTLFPVYLRKIEAAISNVLPRGQIARFNTEAFIRPDEKTQAEIDIAYLGAKVISPDEVRARKGWDGPAPTPTTPAAQEVPAP